MERTKGIKSIEKYREFLVEELEAVDKLLEHKRLGYLEKFNLEVEELSKLLSSTDYKEYLTGIKKAFEMAPRYGMDFRDLMWSYSKNEELQKRAFEDGLLKNWQNRHTIWVDTKRLEETIGVL